MALKPNKPDPNTATAQQERDYKRAQEDAKRNPARWANGPEHTPGNPVHTRLMSGKGRAAQAG